MEAWAREFLDVFRQRKLEIAEAFHKSAQQNPGLPVKSYTLDDFVQMTDGFVAVFNETIEGKSTDIWDTYVNSVIPGILAQGQPLSQLVGQVTGCAVIFYQELIPYLKPEHREEATTLLVNWYTKFNSTIVRIGLEFNAGG